MHNAHVSSAIKHSASFYSPIDNFLLSYTLLYFRRKKGVHSCFAVGMYIQDVHCDPHVSGSPPDRHLLLPKLVAPASVLQSINLNYWVIE